MRKIVKVARIAARGPSKGSAVSSVRSYTLSGVPPARPPRGAVRALRMAGIAMAVATVAHAQLEAADVALPSVTVTASRGQLDPTLQPVSASVVGAQQIESTPAQALDDVLSTVPGLNLPDFASYAQHPTANSVSMRGLGGLRALVLRDGIPLNDPFFGYVQWSRVPLESIDRVEVVRGGYSSAWGNYAMGGVVNIVSREPAATQTIIHGGYGSQDTWRANGFQAIAVSPALTLLANANAWSTGGYNEVPPELRAPLDIPTSFESRSGELAAQLHVDASLGGFVRAAYYENDQTLGTPLSTNWQRNVDLSVGFHKRLDNRLTLEATAFHSDEHFWTANTGTPDGYARGTAEYVQNLHNTPVKDSGASMTFSRAFDGVLRSLGGGVDLRLIDGEDRAQIFDETGAQVRVDVGRGKQQFAGAFLQAEFFPVQGLQVVAALRQEWFRNYDGYDGNPGGLGAVPDQRASSTDPRLSARYAIDDRWALRGAAYRAFRAPTLDNLYRGYAIPGGIFLPDAALKPERLEGGEIGVDFDAGPVRAQVTAYTNTIRDLITYRNLADDELPPGFFFGTRNINAGKARTRGIEGEVEYSIDRVWKVQAAYAYNDPRILDNPADPATEGRVEGNIPRNTASAQVFYARGPLTASTRLRYVQGYTTDNAGTLPIDSYAVVDLSASYALTPSLRIFAQVENLLDRSYIAQNFGNATPSLGAPFGLFAGLRLVLP